MTFNPLNNSRKALGTPKADRYDAIERVKELEKEIEHVKGALDIAHRNIDEMDMEFKAMFKVIDILINQIYDFSQIKYVKIPEAIDIAEKFSVKSDRRRSFEILAESKITSSGEPVVLVDDLKYMIVLQMRNSLEEENNEA